MTVRVRILFDSYFLKKEGGYLINNETNEGMGVVEKELRN